MEMFIESELIKAEAMHLGFSACGMARAGKVDEKHWQYFDHWLKEGCNASMAYMTNYREIRLDPRLLLEGAETVVSVAMNYYPKKELSTSQYQFAWYAYGKDYHSVLKNRLSLLLQKLRESTGLGERLKGRICCDTAPILERYWAMQAGLGWIGRNTQLIVHGQGSCFFLGELLLNAGTNYDAPSEPGCGDCTKCLSACPTHAIGDMANTNGGLDARRCLSYWSIEHRGELPSDISRKMGHYVYGCDRCQKACPHNRCAQPTKIAELQPSEDFMHMRPTDWNNLTVERYKVLFKDSAVKRVKYDGLMRNIGIKGEM
jgi:epoxyqueuosine reductase